MKKIDKYHNYINIYILMVLSIFFILPLQMQHSIHPGDDLPFQMNRIQELIDNIRDSRDFFPYLYTYNYDGTGYLLGVFYPAYTLIPFALFSLLLKNTINGVYLGIAFYNFLSMIFIYHVARKINFSQKSAFFSAIFYGFSIYHTINAFTRFALGEYISMSFLPLVVYGIYAIMSGKEYDWPYLAVGLSIVMLTHVLSMFIYTLLVLGIFLWMFSKVKDKVKAMKAITLAVIVFIMNTLIFLIPFIEEYTNNNYAETAPRDMNYFAESFGKLILASLDNKIIRVQDGNIYSIGFILFCIIIMGFFMYGRLKKMDKILLIVGVLFFLLSSSIFPWNLMMHTPIKIIQFPFRLLGLSTFFLSLAGGKMMGEFKLAESKFMNILMTVVLLISWYSSVHNFSISPSANGHDLYLEGRRYNQGGKEHFYYWYFDNYTTKKAKEKLDGIFKKRIEVNGVSQSIKARKSINNGFILEDKNLENKNSVIIPMVKYKNIRVFQRGKELETKISQNETLEILRTKVGKIKVIYIPSKVDIISKYISIVTWGISLIIFMIRLQNKKLKNYMYN